MRFRWCYPLGGRVTTVLARLVLLLLLLPLGCSKRDGGAQALNGRCASEVEPLPDHIQRGISVAHNYQHDGERGYGSKTSSATLRELAELGVEWVSLTPFGFMRSLGEAEVHAIGGYRAGETDDRMRREIAQAKALGLKVMLKPHIWIVGGQWRGEIELPDPQAWRQWFDSYQRWILAYADMAEAQGADILVIGVELRSTERRQESRWRALAAEVRKRFGGKLTYSANWDDIAAVPWWDAVDYIGIQFYPPLAEEKDAKPSSLRARVTEQLDAIEGVSRRHQRPVLLTEVGYRAASDALVRPHAWPERTTAVPFDPQVQALGYQVLLEAVRARPWVRGLYWWKWFTDPGTREEGRAGFSPRGKPAESILRAAYGGRCDR